MPDAARGPDGTFEQTFGGNYQDRYRASSLDSDRASGRRSRRTCRRGYPEEEDEHGLER